MDELDKRIRNFFYQKSKQDKIRKEISIMERVNPNASSSKLKALRKKMKYEFIIQPDQLIIKGSDGSVKETIDRVKRTDTKSALDNLYSRRNELISNLMKYKYDLLFEYELINEQNEDKLLKKSDDMESELESINKQIEKYEQYNNDKSSDYDKKREEALLDLDVIKNRLRSDELSVEEKKELFTEYNAKQQFMMQNHIKYLEDSLLNETEI